MKYTVLVDVRLRSGIADPAGATIEAADKKQAISHSEDLCGAFLTNPVIEDAEVTVVPGGDDL